MSKKNWIGLCIVVLPLVTAIAFSCLNRGVIVTLVDILYILGIALPMMIWFLGLLLLFDSG